MPRFPAQLVLELMSAVFALSVSSDYPGNDDVVELSLRHSRNLALKYDALNVVCSHAL